MTLATSAYTDIAWSVGTNEHVQTQAVWVASQDADAATFRPRDGWWSLAEWAQIRQLLIIDGAPAGVVALARATDGAAEVRLALVPDQRTSVAAQHLVERAIELAGAARLPVVRLAVPGAAQWAIDAAARHGFQHVRALQFMLRAPDATRLILPPIDGVHVRPIRAGEEDAVLAALNRAWSGTWNFQPLTLQALEVDLQGQREGFLLAVDAAHPHHILGTVHAMFDPHRSNPDGHPYAWISNLTVDPEVRGFGLGRTLLAAGIDALHARGAQSIALGVDSGNPAPLRLYQSAAFRTVDQLEFWERPAS